MNEHGEVYKEYDVAFSALGRPQYLEDLFLAATLILWLSFFVFPNNGGNEAWIKTFLMACQMARGTRTVVGLSCLASYTRLDTVTNKKRSP